MNDFYGEKKSLEKLLEQHVSLGKNEINGNGTTRVAVAVLQCISNLKGLHTQIRDLLPANFVCRVKDNGHTMEPFLVEMQRWLWML